jgi:hypothetical protein
LVYRQQNILIIPKGRCVCICLFQFTIHYINRLSNFLTVILPVIVHFVLYISLFLCCLSIEINKTFCYTIFEDTDTVFCVSVFIPPPAYTPDFAGHP